MNVSANSFAPLPSEIRRRQALARREAAEGVTWHDSCPPELGRKIVALVPELTNAHFRVYRLADNHQIFGSSEGTSGAGVEETLQGEGSNEERLDSVAALLYAFKHLSETDQEEVGGGWTEPEPPYYKFPALVEYVNDVLLAGRVQWHYGDGGFVERGNSTLHAEVVEPVSILLDSDAKFAKASQGFNQAITRLSAHEPHVAITDAASAVQEMFRALGVGGNSISDQLNNAVTAKLIRAVDRSLLKPIVDWINADRSHRGNAHYNRNGEISRADAWLMIHVAGALMVRLSDEEPRDIKAAQEHRQAEAEKVRQAELAAAAQGASEETDLNGYNWSSGSREDPPF